MNARPKYRTKQRDLLLRYLQTMPGEHITASDVCAHFEGQGMPIGQTTVYRQLEAMVDEGLVQKYVVDSGIPACFSYVGEGGCEGEACFHCKCVKCGKLFHLHGNELNAIRDGLRERHHFELDLKRTVFYGLCEACS